MKRRSVRGGSEVVGRGDRCRQMSYIADRATLREVNSVAREGKRGGGGKGFLILVWQKLPSMYIHVRSEPTDTCSTLIIRCQNRHPNKLNRSLHPLTLPSAYPYLLQRLSSSNGIFVPFFRLTRRAPTLLSTPIVPLGAPLNRPRGLLLVVDYPQLVHRSFEGNEPHDTCDGNPGPTASRKYGAEKAHRIPSSENVLRYEKSARVAALAVTFSKTLCSLERFFSVLCEC